MALIYCKDCGKQVSDSAQTCPYCGSPLKEPAGKTVIGIIQLVTLGGCGIWTLVDFIMLLCGSYKDGEGKTISNR